LNAPCVVGAEFKDGKAIIYLDLRRERHHTILGIGTKTKLHLSFPAGTGPTCRSS